MGHRSEKAEKVRGKVEQAIENLRRVDLLALSREYVREYTRGAEFLWVHMYVWPNNGESVIEVHERGWYTTEHPVYGARELLKMRSFWLAPDSGNEWDWEWIDNKKGRWVGFRPEGEALASWIQDEETVCKNGVFLPQETLFDEFGRGEFFRFEIDTQPILDDIFERAQMAMNALIAEFENM